MPRANGAARPKDVAAPADKREGQCASPDGQSAHRTPMSFARFSTALSRSADYPTNPTPASCTSCPAPPCSARTPWNARPASKTKTSASWLGRRRASRSVSTAGRPIRSHDPRQALRRRWRLSFGGPAAPPPRARNLMSIVTGAPDVASARSARSIGDRHGPPVGELGRRYADGDQDRAALTHRDAPPRREAGRRPRPRTPPERGSSGIQRGGVPRQPLGYTRGRLAPPH